MRPISGSNAKTCPCGHKLRGAFNAMRKLPDQKVSFVPVPATMLGVAYMCRQFSAAHFHARHNAAAENPENKNVWWRSGDDDLVGDYFDDCLNAAQAYCAEHAAHFLSPFDDEDVIEGQASAR